MARRTPARDGFLGSHAPQNLWRYRDRFSATKKRCMIRFLYNLLFPFALLFFLPGYVVKMLRRGNYREKFGQRLGFYDAATRAALAPGERIWLHAVSVGEVMIALKLAARMKARTPELRAALTTTTTTGFALATKEAPPWIEVLYTPLDFWP